MAEVLGLVASIVAIGQVAGGALKISRVLFDTVHQYNTAGSGMARFVEDIAQFSSEIDLAQSSMYSAYQTGNLDVNSQESKKVHQLLLKLEDSAFDIVIKLKKLRPRITSMGSSLPIWAKFKWMMNKGEIESLVPRMTSVKQSLVIVQYTVGIALTLRLCELHGSSEEDLKQLRRLRRKVKDLTKQNQQLTEELDMKHRASGNYGEYDPIVGMDFQDALEDLVQDIVESSEAYERDPIPPVAANPVESQISSKSRLQSIRPSASSSISRRTRSSASTPATSHLSSNVAQQSELRPLSVRRLRDASASFQMQTSEAHDVAAVPSPMIAVSHQPAPENTVQVQTSSDIATLTSPERELIREGDFQSVRPSSKILQISDDLTGRNGFHKTSAGKRIPILAMIDSELSENVISLAFVAKHNLEVEYENVDDIPVRIRLVTGESNESLGRVKIKWSDRQYQPPIAIYCLVYEHNVRSLVFGKPFLKKMEHYRSKGSDKEDI